MKTIELNKKVASIEVGDNRIIINLEQYYVPEDGEYFYLNTIDDNKFIGIKRKGEYITSRYYSYDIEGSMLCSGEGWIADDDQIAEIRPATKKEKELLDKALEARGKRWNPETKQIEEIPKLGDFCIFWDDDKSSAKCGVLQELNPQYDNPYDANFTEYFKNCIPFQSVEHFQKFIKG